jgi:hypothetical protein
MNEKLFKRLNEAIELHNITEDSKADALSAEDVIFYGTGCLECIIPGLDEKASGKKIISESVDESGLDSLDNRLLDEATSYILNEFGDSRFDVWRMKHQMNKASGEYDSTKSNLLGTQKNMKAGSAALRGKIKNKFLNGGFFGLGHLFGKGQIAKNAHDDSKFDSEGHYIVGKDDEASVTDQLKGSKKFKKLQAGVNDAEAAQQHAEESKVNQRMHVSWNDAHSSKFMRWIGDKFYGKLPTKTDAENNKNLSTGVVADIKQNPKPTPKPAPAPEPVLTPEQKLRQKLNYDSKTNAFKNPTAQAVHDVKAAAQQPAPAPKPAPQQAAPAPNPVPVPAPKDDKKSSGKAAK